MVNEVIDDILLTEKQADLVVEAAREEAKAKLAGFNAELEKLYDEAELKLKATVESIVKNAERDASLIAADQQTVIQKHINEVTAKAETRFSRAVAAVEKALAYGK